MKTKFFALLMSAQKKIFSQILFISLITSTLFLNGQPGIVGYSVKVFADGPQEINVKEPTNKLTVFNDKDIALVIPKEWKIINPEETYYPYEDNKFKVNLCNENKDQVWIWRERVKIGYFIDEKNIADELSRFAPINEQIKTIHIKGDGPDVKLYIWKAYHIINGKKEPFTVFSAINPAPVFKPNIHNARLFGRSAALDDGGKTEADIIEMAKFLQTYDKSKEDGKKKKSGTFKTIEDEKDDAIVAAISKVAANFKFTFIKADEEEKQAEYDGKKMRWNFQTYPGWAKDEKKITEDPVLWQVPSLVTKNVRVNETVQISPQNLFMIYSRGLEMINTQTKDLIWYRKVGYDNCTFVVGNQKKVIISQKKYGKIILEALETLTGNKLWSSDLEGEELKDWLFDDKTGVLIAVQQEKKETHLIGLELNTGKKLWVKNFNQKSGLSAPLLPELVGSYIITYFDEIEAISIIDGSSRWKNNELKLEDRCPLPQIIGDTILVLDKSNTLHWIDSNKGNSLQKLKLRENAEYTNVFPFGNKIYLRGKLEENNQPNTFFIDAIKTDNREHLWSYLDTIVSVSNIIEDGKKVFTSTWQGPMALDIKTGKVIFKTVVTEVGKTYPVSIRKYGDTITYIGEVVIAGIDRLTGNVLYKHAFNPVSQTMNLDAIDPLCKDLVDYLKFYGKVGLEGNKLAQGDVGYFFNLSSAAQEQATKLEAMSRQNRSMAFFTGNESYYYKSKMQYNSSIINKSFSKAYANVGMMMNIVPTLSKQVAEMTEPERKRYLHLMNDRQELMTLYQTQETGDYAYRKMEERKGNVTVTNIVIINLATGKIVCQMNNERSLADIILNPYQNEYYCHVLSLVPELKMSSENKTEDTAAHAYYLVANKLENYQK